MFYGNKMLIFWKFCDNLLSKEVIRKVCCGFMMDGIIKLGDFDVVERCDVFKEFKMFFNYSNFKYN